MTEFADDTKLFRFIRLGADCKEMQNYINLGTKVIKWQMKFTEDNVHDVYGKKQSDFQM